MPGLQLGSEVNTLREPAVRCGQDGRLGRAAERGRAGWGEGRAALPVRPPFSAELGQVPEFYVQA